QWKPLQHECERLDVESAIRYGHRLGQAAQLRLQLPQVIGERQGLTSPDEPLKFERLVGWIEAHLDAQRVSEVGEPPQGPSDVPCRVGGAHPVPDHALLERFDCQSSVDGSERLRMPARPAQLVSQRTRRTQRQLGYSPALDLEPIEKRWGGDPFEAR